METKKTNAVEKAKIYNLIILDESGSMSYLRNQTISGCNETINTIRTMQDKFADSQEHFVSIFCFQDGGPTPSRYIVKNVPGASAQHITTDDYEPWGNTPLYDAIGSCIADLKHSTKNDKNAIGSITIITDGMENSSRHYSHAQVVNLISQVKELGWNINFIGANIDAAATARRLNIDNHLQFEATQEGTKQMFEEERMARVQYFDKINCCMAEPLSHEEMKDRDEAIRLRRVNAAKDFFNPKK